MTTEEKVTFDHLSSDLQAAMIQIGNLEECLKAAGTGVCYNGGSPELPSSRCYDGG